MYDHHENFCDHRNLCASDHAAVSDLTDRISTLPPTLMQDVTSRFASLDALEHLSDAGLLDLLLSFGGGCGCVQGRSQHLIATFGGFGYVLAARPSSLRDQGGLSATQVLVLKLFAQCSQRLARAKLLSRPILSSSRALMDYCHAALGYRDTEQFRVLFLDRKNALIADELLGQGTVDHVPVYPREVLRRALDLNACALILVHNHPSGDPTPSQADIAMTQAIQQAAQLLSITIHDHVIIGKSCEVSFRAEGLLAA